MLGFKIISEHEYRKEKQAADEIVALNEELVKKNAKLELDIKDLREQNTKLRSINAKRKDENVDLLEKSKKLKEIIKSHENFRHSLKLAFPQIDFKGFTPAPCNVKCSECSFEDTGCKKYTDLSVCMLPYDASFRDK